MRKTDRLLPAGEPKYYPLKTIIAEAQEANKRDRAVRGDLLGKSPVTGYGRPGAPVEPYVAVDVQSAETLVADADEDEDNGAGMRHYQKAEMMVLPPTMPEAEKLLIALHVRRFVLARDRPRPDHLVDDHDRAGRPRGFRPNR